MIELLRRILRALRGTAAPSVPSPEEQRRRVALARGEELNRRLEVVRRGASPEHEAVLAAAMAEEYAALIEEFPDVYKAPPIPPSKVREAVSALRKAEALAASPSKRNEKPN